MTDVAEITLAELERREAAAHANLRAAQKRLGKSKGAAEDVRECREARQLIRDQIEGLKLRQQDSETAKGARTKAADKARCRKALTTALEKQTEYEAHAKAALAAVMQLGERMAALDKCAREIVDFANQGSIEAGRIVRGELLGSFHGTQELVVRELVATGLKIPLDNPAGAIDLVRQRNFIGWVDMRLEKSGAVIASAIRQIDEGD
jgi:hypothetical protein